MKKVLILLSILTFASCSSVSSVNRTGVGVNGSNGSTSVADCTGYQSDLIVPYGLLTTTGHLLRGQKFAKVVAVDGQDGKMKISILPPDGQSSFTTSLISELEAEGYTIRIISCKENTSSVVSGFTTTGVCNSTGPINLVGDATVTSSEFLAGGFTTNATNVHSTKIPTAATIANPNFIMITAGNTSNEVGDIMVAFGLSPYYNGCYSN